MKYLLVLLIIIVGVAVSSRSIDDKKPIAVVTIYYNDAGLSSEVKYDPAYFENEDHIYLRLFERFAILNDRDMLHKYIDEIKNMHEGLQKKAVPGKIIKL
jgi:hypothetical protein